jgi:hypothetical protein
MNKNRWSFVVIAKVRVQKHRRGPGARRVSGGGDGHVTAAIPSKKAALSSTALSDLGRGKSKD